MAGTNRQRFCVYDRRASQPLAYNQLGGGGKKGAPRISEAAFEALLWNLKRIPEVDHPKEMHDLFLQDTSGREITLV